MFIFALLEGVATRRYRVTVLTSSKFVSDFYVSPQFIRIILDVVSTVTR